MIAMFVGDHNAAEHGRRNPNLGKLMEERALGDAGIDENASLARLHDHGVATAPRGQCVDLHD
jgi:hypothetical protein